MEKQILIVVHQKTSNPGLIGEGFVHRGYALDRRCPCIGDTLPNDLSSYDAVVLFGGPQSANDDHIPGIRAELDWLEATVLPASTPLLGICLGAQQIARVMGATVGPHQDGIVEIGYWEVSPTEAGRAFLPQPTMFYQWHAETFEIPSGAVQLARSGTFPSQAYAYEDRVFGIEFHPEMTRQMIDLWCKSKTGSQKLSLTGAQAHDEQLADHDRFATASLSWLDRFVDGIFLSGPTTQD